MEGNDGRYNPKDFRASRYSMEWAQALAYFWQVTVPQSALKSTQLADGKAPLY